MFLADTALADSSPMAPPVTRAQVCPSKCQVPVPGPAPEQPNAQTSLSLTAVIPVASRPEDPGSASATDHWLPFQCRMSPFASVTAPALSGLLFSAIVALSGTDVWAIAGNGSGGAAQLVHFDGSTWTSVKVPYSGITLDYFAPDGHGGFWLDSSSSLSKTTVLHYAATGVWSRAALTSGSMGPIALVPGTTSLWGVGSAATTTPASNARAWEYGHAG